MDPNPDLDDPTPRHLGLEIGTVVDRADPRGLGRVRLRIPGITDRSAWAYPLGAPGGGSADAGMWWIPALGADVAVFFQRGDEDHPWYFPANWGRPGGVSEVPTQSDGGDPDVRVLAFGAYDVIVDTRAATKRFVIQDREAPDDNRIAFDGVNRTLEIKGFTAILLEAVGQIDLNGVVVAVNGVPAGSGQL